MTRKRRRLYLVVALMLALGGATALVLSAFRDNIVFFYAPSDLAGQHVPAGRHFRLGGLVEQGSVSRSGDSATVSFRITDTQSSVPVRYTGLLPDLFREGQGVVAEGSLDADGTFEATEVLAKHDEKYMPPQVAQALKERGEWRPEQK
ncbi:MAG TPA: cytochrome c maturation protein CcmE [Alphaproteobacteria bacterium]|nr:cytochrome c maturation protein CcmE [Alphaproteobacteria bacterium]